MLQIKKLAKKVESKYKQKVALPGISDVIVIRHHNNQYKSTPFTINFGFSFSEQNSKKISLKINQRFIKNSSFHLDQFGNIDPIIPSQQIFREMKLMRGRNHAQFILQGRQSGLQFQIYLYEEEDKIIVSDLDGTLTKSDFYGIINNLVSRNHIHNGYIEFIQSAARNGYQIVWLTMRSINMYKMSKKYITIHTQTPGPLLPWPERILSSLSKQLKKQTVDPKLFLLRNIRQIFPEHINPFAGALGNRQNDALAYTSAEVPIDRIFLVNHLSIVQRWGSHEQISYQHMSQQIQHYFPPTKPNRVSQKTLLIQSVLYRKSSNKTNDSWANNKQWQDSFNNIILKEQKIQNFNWIKYQQLQ